MPVAVTDREVLEFGATVLLEGCWGIEGGTLPEYSYKDYGSLISLSKFSAVGNLMGNLMGTVKVEGWLARMFYISLYRMHQVALCGVFRTALLMLSDRIGRRTDPRLKLH